MKTTDKQLKAVDAEYAQALADWREASKRLKVVGEQRVAAHLDAEYMHSKEAQDAAKLTDAEWAAKQQRIKTARERLRIEPSVPAPSAG